MDSVSTVLSTGASRPSSRGSCWQPTGPCCARKSPVGGGLSFWKPISLLVSLRDGGVIVMAARLVHADPLSLGPPSLVVARLDGLSE